VEGLAFELRLGVDDVDINICFISSSDCKGVRCLVERNPNMARNPVEGDMAPHLEWI
jgi:hypothetical protein